ncbi:MAG: hypothetical protein EOP11_12285 [Proteobacteria bacterium]|nr:MAG: hypothetical protein EOP11_12285 [Pseudomonadota bacterium]
MKTAFYSFLGLGLLPLLASAKLCEEVPYQLRAYPILRGVATSLPSLLSKEEQATGAGKQISLTPGPYGHSELGFRYLSRLFGYEGDFTGGKESVERWITEQEIKQPRLNHGLSAKWDHWVVNAPKRLGIPQGFVSRMPADGNPDILFAGLKERFEMESCVGMDIASLQCANYLGVPSLKTGHMISFGKPGGRGVCSMKWFGPIADGPMKSETYTRTKRTQSGDHAHTQNWERNIDDTGSNPQAAKSAR